MLDNSKTMDRRVRRSLERISRAFGQLIQEKPIDSITVQDIAERADINRSTFYQHFEDKYALLDHTIRARFERQLHDIIPDIETFSIDHLKQLVFAAFDYIQQFNNGCHPAENKVRPVIEMQVRAVIYERLFSWFQQIDVQQPQGTASMISWAIFGTALDWNKNPNAVTRSAMTQHVFNGIMPTLSEFSAIEALPDPTFER